MFLRIGPSCGLTAFSDMRAYAPCRMRVGRIFRNEGMDTAINSVNLLPLRLFTAHLPITTTSVELVEELYMLRDKICGTRRITYQGQEIDLDHWGA